MQLMSGNQEGWREAPPPIKESRDGKEESRFFQNPHASSMQGSRRSADSTLLKRYSCDGDATRRGQCSLDALDEGEANGMNWLYKVSAHF